MMRIRSLQLTVQWRPITNSRTNLFKEAFPEIAIGQCAAQRSRRAARAVASPSRHRMVARLSEPRGSGPGERLVIRKTRDWGM